jgi:hypothetical protein
MLKSNKGCGRNIAVQEGVVQGKEGGPLVDLWPIVLQKMSRWGDVYNNISEPWYEFTKPKILVEQMMEPVPDDIRVHVLNNKVELIYYNKGPAPRATNVYDADFNLLPYHSTLRKPDFNESLDLEVQALKNPAKVAEIKAIALRLAEDVPLDIVRIDMYHINNAFYGSEVTLASSGGGDFIKLAPSHPDWRYSARSSSKHKQKKIHKEKKVTD